MLNSKKIVAGGMACGTLVSLIALSGCGAAEAIRKEAPTANAAMGDSCDAEAESTNVYVLDLPPDRRSDIELALGNEGLAVVSFNCKQLKILKTCKASGSYAFRGTSPKERVLTLESGDAIRAALPLGGAGIAASFEAEASTGTKFDLGLILVGQSVGSSSSFSVAELTGNCEGATHVITAGKLGAFAMGTSSKAEVKTAVELFGAGVGANSSSSKLAKSRDGSIEACNEAETSSSGPPKRCDAILAVEVTKLTKGIGAVAVDPFFALTYGDDGCAGEIADCEEACNAGKGRGCRQVGISLINGTGGVDTNIPRGVQLLKKGCDLGDVKGCAALGSALSFESRPDEAIPLLDKACTIGNDIDGCFGLGLVWELDKNNKANAIKAFDKACQGGLELACSRSNALNGIDPTE